MRSSRHNSPHRQGSIPAATHNSATTTGPDSTRRTDLTQRSDNRFSKQHRLPDATSFSRVFAKASKSRDNLFTVLSRDNGKDHARLGLAISKKSCRRATQRNRLKRLVRESFRHHQAELSGLDIVVLGQQGTSQADNRALVDSLTRHWQRTRSAHPRAS